MNLVQPFLLECGSARWGCPNALRTIRSKQGEQYAVKPGDIVTLRVKGFTIRIIVTPEAGPP